MVFVIDLIMFLLVLTNLALLVSSRLKSCVLLAAFQGMVLGFLPVLIAALHGGGAGWHGLFLAAAAIMLKGLVFPVLLLRAMRQANVRREIEPFVGYNLSIMIGVAALAAAIWVSHYLKMPSTEGPALAVPLAFFTVFTGIFLIISRKKALTQVIGYLVLENGIYTFGIVAMPHAPLVVELGILLDLLVAIFVMGIMIFHISSTFDHIDVSQMRGLGDE